MARQSDPPPDRAPPAGEPEARGLERWIAPYFRDSTLWPVLAVAAATAVTGLASLLLLAAVDRSPYAATGVLVLAWIGVDVALRERRALGRTGLAGRSVLALWALGAVAALAAWRGGLF